MTDDLYLIAHKVRGEPAFDIAIHMQCPHCNGQCHTTEQTSDYPICHDCHECDGIGHWWIIPTSGHRAFPYYDIPLTDLGQDVSWPGEPEFEPFLKGLPPMPADLRDHYLSEREATKSLVDMLGIKAKKLPPIVRRL